MNEEKHRRKNILKWNRWAETYDRDDRTYAYLRDSQDKILGMLPLHEGIHFLDVGCGTGRSLEEAAKRINGAGQFYGVDISPAMIEKAIDRFRGKIGFHVAVATAEEIPLPGGYFDVIICTNSFHHHFHPQKSMNEFSRLLKTGGRVYILDPTADTRFARFIDFFIRMFEPEHVKLYSTREFQNYFTRAGIAYRESIVLKQFQKVHIGEK